MPAANTDSGARAAQPKKKVVARVKAKPPTAKQVTQARTQEQTYGSQAHNVRVQANRQSRTMGKSPSGDRPQNRAREMDKAPVRRAIVVDPNTGREISTLKTPEAPRGAQQRGKSPAGDRPQGRAKEMRQAPTVKAKRTGGGAGGPLMASISAPGKLAGKYVAAVQWKDPRGTLSGGADFARTAALDAAELGVTTPSSVAKLASVSGGGVIKSIKTGSPKPAIKAQGDVIKSLAQPYIDLAKDPKKAVSEHPVSTALMLAPAVRVPGRVVGRAARVAGKQTLERPAASLPRTALKEKRTGSRDVVVRAVQARADKKNPAPTMTEKEVQRRADEHFDVAKQHTAHAEAEAVRATRKATKGQPKQQRRDAVTAAREKAREVAGHENDERFAREFGATGRLSTGAAEREIVGRQRKTVVAQLGDAKTRAAAADAAHADALANAKTARGRVQRSSRLSSLEAQRRTAQRALVSEQRAQNAARKTHAQTVATGRVAAAKGARSPRLDALESHRGKVARDLATAERKHADAMAEFGVARGRGQVLSRNVAGDIGERRAVGKTVEAGSKPGAGVATQYAGGGHGVTLAAENLKAAAGHASELQSRLQRVDQAIKAERKRLRAVPSSQRRGVIQATATRDEMPSRVRTARESVRTIDRDIAAERDRINGIPSAEHQALLDTIHGRAEARTTLSAARAAAEDAKAQHITVKTAMRGASIINPATEGRLFAHKADAATIVRKLNEQIPDDSPMTFVVHQAGDKYAAVPQAAKARISKHKSVGSSPAVMAKVMRRSRQAFTQAVLPLSPKWLAGQAVEAGVRSAIARAGPMDVLRTNRVVKKLNAAKPGSGDELLMRISGGQFGMTGTAREFAEGKSLADEFADTGLKKPAKAATAIGRTPPLRAVRAGWSKYTSTVLDSVNGVIENTSRKAMAGQAIKQGPLMERHVLGLTDRALEDAAHGLKGTESQVRLAREVDRMYGKYQKFSPEKRSMLLHWTPFLPWYLNVATFLTKVLPVDHPVVTALLASASMATEDWRKEHHLSLRDKNHVPGFLLGSAPAGADSYRRIGHYLPFAPADPAEAAGALLLPQATGTLANLAGVDWKGQRLKRPGYAGKEFNVGEKTIRAAVTAAESQIPGVAQAGRWSGVTARVVDKKDPAKIPGVVEALKKELPTATTKSAAKKPAGSRVVGKVKLNGAGAGGARLNGSGSGGAKLN